MQPLAEPDERAQLGARLDATYEALVCATSRHFGESHEGWSLSGVAGLDTPTMNRVTVRDAPATQIGPVVAHARAFFEERRAPWSVVLSTHRDITGWHTGLMARGFRLTSTLDVLAREPGRIEDAMPANIRVADAGETGAFTDLLIEVFHMPRRFYPALVDMSDAWRAVGGKLYFAMEEGERVATTLLVEKDGVAGIYNVGTRRAWRRRGLARSLMARAMEDARDADVVTLQVAPASPAEAFYLRIGFEPVHAWRFYGP